MRHCYATSILSLFLLSHGLAAAESPFEGQSIVSVGYEPAEQPLAQRELNEIMPVKAAQEYSAEGIREAIERLFATGRYEDIQVDASPAHGGVAIRFITKNSWFVGKVATKGEMGEPPNAGQIVNASRLRLGDSFDMDAVPMAVENIRKLLIQNGYFDPVVTTEFEYDSAYQQVNITFVLKTGKRASYLPPQVSGDTSVLSAKAITSATRWHRFLVPGYRGITLSRTRSGIDNVRLKYENANRLLATVVLDGIDEEKAANKGLARITVNPGPTVKVTTPGTSLSKRKLHENVPVFEERTVDNDQERSRQCCGALPPRMAFDRLGDMARAESEWQSAVRDGGDGKPVTERATRYLDTGHEKPIGVIAEERVEATEFSKRLNRKETLRRQHCVIRLRAMAL